jgi:hypothetical protein
MTLLRALPPVGLMSALWLVACGGGGPLVTTSSTGRDDPGLTRDDPGATRDSPTSDTGASDCIVCDVVYACPQSSLQSMTLSTSGGTCTAALIDLVCSGALFGAASCSVGGGGAFTCGTVTCTPETQSGNGTGATGG